MYTSCIVVVFLHSLAFRELPFSFVLMEKNLHFTTTPDPVIPVIVPVFLHNVLLGAHTSSSIMSLHMKEAEYVTEH